MATRQHIIQYKQSNPRSGDISDNRTEATRKDVAGGGDGEGGAGLCGGRRHSDDGQRLGAGHSLSRPELWEGAAPDPQCPLAVTLIFL